MPEMPWTVKAAFAATAATLALAGCSSSGSSSETPAPEVTVTETAEAAPTEAAPTSAATTGGGSSSESVPEPPSGAQEVDESDDGGVSYTRFKISGTTPEDVVNGYESQLKSSGFTIINAGGSGGGWGQYGGSGYGMDASKGAEFVSVQAGGESSGPTYFEVCVGSSKAAVENCAENSQDEDSDSKGS